MRFRQREANWIARLTAAAVLPAVRAPWWSPRSTGRRGDGGVRRALPRDRRLGRGSHGRRRAREQPVHPVNQIVLRWEAASAHSYRIQTSTDGATWTDIHTTGSGTGGTEAPNVSGSSRYVRVYGSARDTGWGYSLHEFEVYAVPPEGADCGRVPADPGAGSKARSLLCYLGTHAYVSGQTDVADSEKVRSLTGRYPAITAFDFMEHTRGRIQTQSVIDWYDARHGIVAFPWHWYCPRGGDYSAPCDLQPDPTDPSSKPHRDVDLVVAQPKRLGDAGIPVLFRPCTRATTTPCGGRRRDPTPTSSCGV